MNIIIVEDEIHNQRMLEGMLQKIKPDWKILKCLDSVKETTEYLKNNSSPDLIFMDIQLIDGLCFSIFENVDVKSLLIFTTAFDEYAIQAFKVNSIDYLLKPIKEEELKNSIIKFENFFNKTEFYNPSFDYKEIMKAIKIGEKKYRKRFLISKGDSFIKLKTENIAYFYSENKISYAVTFDKIEHILNFSLDKLQEQLKPDKFYRANRKFIVNIDAIQKIENYFSGKLILKIKPPFKEKISISRLKAVDFKQWIDK